MRLLSLTVKNYRLHKERTLDFDPARNLIGGPNESGKSTLAEAIHRALFLRAKTGGALREEMRSKTHQGDPEVTLTFEASGSRWTLEKRFAGPKGSALLTNAAGAVLRDEEADAKLAELHQCDTTTGRASADKLSGFWSHLWVWQGSAGNDPARHAGEHKDHLVQRLQQQGLAAVLQSPADQRARERITAAYDELFTATGKPKAGSKPETARLELTKAEAALQRAQETAARLDQAAADHQRAEQEIAETDALLPGLRQQKTLTETKLAEVAALRRDEENALRHWTAAAARLQQLTEQDAVIRKLHDQAAAARAALVPAERLEAGLQAEHHRAADLSQASETALRQTAETVRLTRFRHDLAAACLTSLEKAADHTRLAARAADADALQVEIAALQASLDQLPDLTPQDLEIIRQSDRALSQARAGLDAMATGIEVLSTALEITLDGQPLTPGQSRTLTDEGLLAIGPDTRLRIRPGGGLSLADARQRVELARRKLAAELDRHTLRDPDHATAILHQRQTLTQQAAQHQTAWKALGGASIHTELAAAASAFESAKAEVHRRLSALDPDNSSLPPDLPDSLETARHFLAQKRAAMERAGEAETAARHHADQHRQRLEAAAQTLKNHRDLTAQARQTLREQETRHQVLQETHGDDEARTAALTQATLTDRQTASQLAALRESLTNLAPDLLSADADRWNRAISQNETRRRDAENRHLVARDRLSLDGSSDPHAELAHARAREAAARELHASEDRRARAIQKLHELFSSARETIDRSIVQPLADRITGYLQCLFGPGARIQIQLSGDGIDGFELLRANDPAFTFDSLSGGAKEQVAAAVRLAMAEILSPGHDGCLPIVLDDAFAYADPARVQSLQRMLDLAASRGLQIIVLTCTPADYTAFGARDFRLS